MIPKRIQRKRVRGWRMPENTVNVTRPGKWGNPFRVSGGQIYIDAGYRKKAGKWALLCFGDTEKAVRLFRCVAENRLSVGEYGIEIRLIPDIVYHAKRFAELDLSELRNKNLACFCGPDEFCHADVLIELANNPAP